MNLFTRHRFASSLARRVGTILPLALLFLAVALALLPGAVQAQGSTGAISGEVWYDRNRNGLREPEEPLLDDIEIRMEHNGQPTIGSRGVQGQYIASALPAGTYTLRGLLRDGSRVALTSPQQSVSVAGNGVGVNLGLSAPVPPRDGRYYAQTGYRIDNDDMWGYFRERGGLDTFGYPVSRPFRFRGFWVQVFQRHVLQVVGPTARPLNLLDPEFLPITRLNGSTFPIYDPAVARLAPTFDTPDYGNAVLAHLQATVPNQWDGARVGFLDAYLDAVPTTTAPPALVALEIWGFPTSRPARDPNNRNFIYQRFQRGILHHDATTGITRGILLGDALKSVLTNQNLPSDLAADLSASPFLGLYDPAKLNGLSRVMDNRLNPPAYTGNSNLLSAFEPE